MTACTGENRGLELSPQKNQKLGEGRGREEEKWPWGLQPQTWKPVLDPAALAHVTIVTEAILACESSEVEKQCLS